MPNVGKMTTLVIFAMAAVVAAGTLWYQHRVSYKVLEIWGSDAAALILQSPEAETLEFDSSAGLEAAAVFHRRGVTETRGLNHIRRALVQDSTYDWDAAPPQKPVLWQAAIRFLDGAKEAQMLLCFDHCRIALKGSPHVMTLQPVACAELKALVQEH